MSPSRSLAALLAATTMLTAPALAQDASAERPGFAHIGSDLPHDPRIHYGELDNGVRYAVMQNDSPSGTASIRLRIAAGSLAEADGEGGIAHYLEHMAFNGSENFEEGEMVRTLERHGLSFGGDTNAHTSFDETVYKLNLPNTDEDTFDVAMMLMRETAEYLTLADEAIDRERGIILSEMRSRNTLQYREILANWAFLTPQSGLVESMPIGTHDSVSGLTSEQIRGFYHTHYHPQRAFVVIVGDLPVERAQAYVEQWFGDWESPREPGPIVRTSGPSAMTPGAVAQFADPDVMPSVSIAVQHPYVDEPDNAATRRQTLVEQLGNRILSQRFRVLSHEPDATVQRGFVRSGKLQGSVETATIEIGGHQENWQANLALAEQELRRALQHGFSEAELARELVELRAHYESEADAADSAETHSRFGGLTREIIQAYDSDRVMMHPADQLAWFETASQDVTAEEVTEAFRANWTGYENPLVFLSTTEEIADLETQVANILAESRAVAVEAPEDDGDLEFAYTDFGDPGTVVSDVTLDEEDARLVRFANNVHLNIKRTEYTEGEVQVVARVGDGALSLPRRDEGLRRLALNLLNSGGLEAHTSLEIDRILAGSGIGSRLFFAEDSSNIRLSGTAPVDRMPDLLNLLTAYTTAPGMREDAGERYKDRLSTWYPTHDSTPMGVASREIPRLIRSGDPRFGFGDLDNFLDADHTEAAAWLEEQLTQGAIELTVIGDVDPDAVIAEVARTFGAVNTRPEARGSYPEQTALVFPDGDETPVTFTHTGEADQALLRVYWPTPDGTDVQTTREMRVLRGLVRNRMVDEIRERTGAAYSPGVGMYSEPDFPGYGYIFVHLELEPEGVPGVLDQVDMVASELRSGSIGEDEFQRALRPIAGDLESSTQNNGYWDYVLSDAQSGGWGLDDHRTRVSGYEAVSLEDVQALAREVFAEGNAVRVQILPEDETGDDGDSADGVY